MKTEQVSFRQILPSLPKFMAASRIMTNFKITSRSSIYVHLLMSVAHTWRPNKAAFNHPSILTPNIRAKGLITVVYDDMEIVNSHADKKLRGNLRYYVWVCPTDWLQED